MKRIIIAAFAFLLAISSSWAQDADVATKTKKTPEQRAENFTKKMTKELALDAAQQEKVKAFNLDRFKQIDETRNTTSGNRKDMAGKVKAINETFSTNLKSVLTPEQFAKYETMKGEMKEKAFDRREGRK